MPKVDYVEKFNREIITVHGTGRQIICILQKANYQISQLKGEIKKILKLKAL